VATQPKFQDEPEELVAEIFSLGYITPWNLFKIVSWKSARGLAWLSLNTEEEIRSVTEELVDGLRQLSETENVLIQPMKEEDWNEWQRLAGELVGADGKKNVQPSGLLRLQGVGYPVATAVLGLLKPNVFPVMDRWAVETIFGHGAGRKTWQWHTKGAYRKYTERLVNPECEFLNEIKTLRKRDIAAMNASKAGKPIEGYVPIRL
jgi:hypothetical protein